MPPQQTQGYYYPQFNLPPPPARYTKLSLALKPDPLTRDVTLVEFRIFMKKFLAYHETSNMAFAPTSVQLEYFGACP